MGKKPKEKAAPAKPFADMTPEEQAAYVAQLEKDNASLKSRSDAQAAKLKEVKVDDVDTSFEADGKTYDFVGKLIHIDGETLDVRDLINDGSDEALAKFDSICAKLVKSKSGIIKEI